MIEYKLKTIKSLAQIIYMVCLYVFFASATYSDPAIYKWQDEKGQFHYGRVVPPQFAESAKEVNVENTNLIDSKQVDRNTKNGFKKNYTQPSAKSPQTSYQNSAPKEKQPVLTQSQCRDKFKSRAKVKQRVACFNKASSP